MIAAAVNSLAGIRSSDVSVRVKVGVRLGTYELKDSYKSTGIHDENDVREGR